VLDRKRDHGHALAGPVVAGAGAGWKDSAAVRMLLLPREIAPASRHVAVAAAVEDGDHMLLHVEVADFLAERGGRSAAAATG
jgi:hypothetical protein